MAISAKVLNCNSSVMKFFLLAVSWFAIGGISVDDSRAAAGTDIVCYGNAARYLFAVFLIPIGLSHLMYVKETIDLVPKWLPSPIFWAYLTGAGQMACGLGVLFRVLPRAAALTEAGMISMFGLLVWLPKVIAAPKARLPWTAFWITWAIGSAAWVVALDLPSRQMHRRRKTLDSLSAVAHK